MQRISVLFILIAVIAATAGAQPGGTTHASTDSTRASGDTLRIAIVPRPDKRIRIMGGFIAPLRSRASGARMGMPYLNVNYRYSTPPLSVARSRGVSFEVGFNYLFPYVSCGPEFRWGSYLLTAEGGVTLLAGPGAVVPLLFGTVGGGYLINTLGLGTEISMGTVVLWSDGLSFAPYAGFAVAFR